jgi:ribonucleoside-diphosphate reductase beta chain
MTKGPTSLAEFGELSRKYNLFAPRYKISKVARNSHYEIFHPVNAIDSGNNAPIHYLIRGTQDFINFEGSYLLIEGKFVGGTPAASGVTAVAATSATADYGPVNLLGHSMFKSVDVTLNGTSVSMADQNYPYRAYIQRIFNQVQEALDKTFSLEGWAKDVPGKMDETAIAQNTALQKRRKRANAKGEVTFIVKLVCPIFQIDELFPSKVDVGITLHKNPNNKFYMMFDDANNTNYDFQITKAEMWVHKITVDPEYGLAVEQILNENHPIEYILSDPRVDVHQIPSGVPSFQKDHITYGNLCRRLLIGFLDTTAYNGTNKMNPFNFQHFDVRKISLHKDGLEYPRPAIICKMGDKKFTDAYYHILSTFHANGSPFSMDIDETDLENGFFFAAWEFSPDQLGGDIPQGLVNQGTNIHLSVEFGAALAKAVSIIVYYELDMKVSINQYRQVTVESH